MTLAFYLIVYTIALYGFCNVMVYGGGPFDILVKFREGVNKIHPTFGDLMSCMMCFPTNVGLILSLINLFFVSIAFTPGMILFQEINQWYLIIPFDMFYASGAVWLLHTLQEMMERSPYDNNDEDIEMVNGE